MQARSYQTIGRETDRMTQSVSLLKWRVLCVVVLTSLFDVTSAKCPWSEDGLLLWSDPNTWDDGQVPGFEAEVTVNKRVLLDIQPPSLRTITVPAGGALVWGNVRDITLNVTYIVVYGEFHIGSEDCRFRKQATINLYGLSNSTYQVGGFGRKFVGVAPGGTLEFHGLDKMSWTKLAHTIPPALDLQCSLVYSHTTSSLVNEQRRGLHVLAWNSDGSVRDFNVFDANNFNTLPEFLSGLPAGSVVAASVKKGIGAPTETVYAELESLGSKSIRSVLDGQNYAFLAKTGDKSSAQETVQADEYVLVVDTSRDLAFRVASLSDNSVDFQVMDGEAALPKITVQHDVSSWSVGDEILVTSTDFDWRQAEVKKIIACGDCAANQIKLDSPFENLHYGEVTLNVDERAEVALLTRNVKIQGQLEDECYSSTANERWLCSTFKRDLFGGHVKAVFGATFHVEGVELFQLGQQQNQAAYPLHFHMMNDASGMYVRNTSIHHTLARCVTVHGTHHAEVSDNVCYLHLGHGYFMEDSVEQNNTFSRNLGVGTMHGSLLLSDRHSSWCGDLALYCDDIATFWLTHPNNIVNDNVAAGSDGSGYFFVFADAPIGVSKNVPWILEVVANHSLQYYPLKSFSGNVAHSNFKSGIFFDSKISTDEMDGNVRVPENGILPGSPSYDPRDPPNLGGKPVWTDMARTTLYKNERENAWVKGGNIRMIQSSFADSSKGFTGGTIGEDSGTMVKDSVFIGQTDNTGMPEKYVDKKVIGNPTNYFNHSLGRNPYDSWTGIGFYQGPVFVENCYFDRYGHYWWNDGWEETYGFRPVRPGGAISFQRSNIYPTKPWTHVKDIKFGYCDNVNDGHWVFKGNLSTYGWGYKDGNRAHTFRDIDGSVTGQANTQVVIDRPFYTGDECVSRDNWHMTACPYKYVQMELVGSDGVLVKAKKTQFPLIVRRDDVPQDAFQVEGTQKNKFLMRTHRSYTVNFNQTLGDVPKFFDVRAFNVEKGDVVRVGLCLPKDTTTFEVRSFYPSITKNNPHTMVSSLLELDNDLTGRKFFWDASVGLLYFKLVSNETRRNLTEECANDVCVRYKITRLDGGNGPTDCSGYSNPPIADNSVPPTPPQPKTCTGPDSREGLGAVPSDVVTADPFTVTTCPVLDPQTGRGAPERRGCFKDKSATPDVPFFTMDLPNGMTQQWCQDRCYYRGYTYSAVTLGRRCSCGDTFGLFGALADSKCSTPCSGDKASTCGYKNRVEVFTTGLGIKPVPLRCGPNNLGEVVDGVCLYAEHQIVTVGEAQRVCARLGGNLVAIDSMEKQGAVEYYLRDKMTLSKVWTGLNNARDSTVFEQRDASRLGSFTYWKGTNGADLTKPFVYITGVDGYKWIQTKDSLTAAPLCDLPLSPPVSDVEACGEKDEGRRFGATGTCYLAVHQLMSQETANYACRTVKGKLAGYTDRASEEELNHALFRLGVDQDYWTANTNKVIKWSNSVYAGAKVLKTDVAGALCVLDTLDSTNRCPTDWVENGGSCYLTLGTVVKSYSAGAALCERGSSDSHLVRVDSEAENTFLSTLVPTGSAATENMLLGFYYSPRHDQFVWQSGDLPTYSSWSSGNGKQNLAGGSCAVLDSTTSGSWSNAPCDQLTGNLVCEMPAFVV
ncbi:cell surface hyaluronidase CEMIP2-like isoform X2 [Littorina saxatilis]